ncbi:MAG: helix-turn-helix transcriptional regulator [Clostridia bacterium]|nr:helix-turn-helix transcriptional regulator [Clostridia bacterium]
MENLYLSTLTKDNFFSWLDINHGSRSSDAMPLVVNVAARVNTEIECTNYNKKGRLDYYLVYVFSGSASIKTKHGVANSYENELFIIPANTPYEFKTVDLPLRYLCVHFTGSQVEEILSSYGISMLPKINKLSYKNHMQLRFTTLFEAFAKNDSLRERELSILLERLLIEASRAVENEALEKISLSKSVRFINENYPSKIKITDLAKMENMCMTSYNLLFKQQMGLTPTKYIMKLRLEHAQSLLESTSLSIDEIGTLCGYSDINFFSRAFKSFMGLSPSNYRKQIITL